MGLTNDIVCNTVLVGAYISDRTLLNRIPATETITVDHRVPDEPSAYVIWGWWDPPIPDSERGALIAFGVNRKGRYSREAIWANR